MSLFGGPRESVADHFVLPRVAEYSLREKLSMEKETIGLYLSGHPMNDYRPLAERIGSSTILEIKTMAADEGADDRNILLCAIVLTKRTKTTKNNDVMAFVTVEDMTGSLEVLVFPKVLALYGGILNLNEAVVIEARISARDEEDVKLVASRFFTPAAAASGIPSARSADSSAGGASGSAGAYSGNGTFGSAGRSAPESAPAAGMASAADLSAAASASANRGLYIRVPSAESREYRRAMAFLAVFSGLTPLYIHLSDTKKTLRASPTLWVDTSEGDGYVIKRLAKMLGEENVRMK